MKILLYTITHELSVLNFVSLFHTTTKVLIIISSLTKDVEYSRIIFFIVHRIGVYRNITSSLLKTSDRFFKEGQIVIQQK